MISLIAEYALSLTDEGEGCASMPHFNVEHLREEQLTETSAFLQMAGAESVSGWWENEARELMRRGGGVIVVRAADGALHGLATYEVIKRRHTGRALAVARLVSFELSRKQPAKQALLNALDLISGAFECSAVALPLPAKGFLRHLSGNADPAASATA